MIKLDFTNRQVDVLLAALRNYPETNEELQEIILHITLRKLMRETAEAKQKGPHRLPKTWRTIFAQALKVKCPKCEAQPGHVCTTTGGLNSSYAHAERRDLARENFGR